jgi:hypothetical protein
MIDYHVKTLAPEKRGLGRPKGLGRVPGSGRKPGTPNRTTAELREQITAARPVEFLIKVAKGRRIRIGPQAGPGEAAYAYPSLEQRLRAAELLMKKILPDLTAAEVTGPGGGPLQVERSLSALGDLSDEELAFLEGIVRRRACDAADDGAGDDGDGDTEADSGDHG